jgi:hypothetical protein
MIFKNYKAVDNDFFSTITQKSKNSIIFENHSIRELYINKSIKGVESSKFNICYYRELLIERYGSYLKQTAEAISLSDEQKLLYDQNPYLCSFDVFNDPDYWWLILYINDYMSIFDFTKLPNTLSVPDRYRVRECITKEGIKNMEMGKLITDAM